MLRSEPAEKRDVPAARGDRDAWIGFVRSLPVDLVEQARQPQAAAQELLLDDGGLRRHVVVGEVRPLGRRLVDLPADATRLGGPLGRGGSEGEPFRGSDTELFLGKQMIN